ncbi:PDZ domain-containing protein [Crateriforma conspicua]|uniref:Zinc metallopeptidase RseP n=1 Tax=Crateriforma conspicua TaxID=2527996 RepID=A0A5C6FZM1_9PLAN|nr:PDZ domain-containing protein [Crateriforma conspicua]TWU67055.1 zinc metallopeptidase RseP [Crateriforma conspicua]
MGSPINGLAAILLAGVIGSLLTPAPAHAQGLFRRLGNRIRGIAPPTVPPPPVPGYDASRRARGNLIRPNTTSEGSGPVVRNRVPVSPTPDTDRGLQRISPRNDGGGNPAGSNVFEAPLSETDSAGDRGNASGKGPGRLGVEALAVTRPVRGVRIHRILPGSNLRQSGLAEGDILVQFNNRSVTDVDELAVALRSTSPGEDARVRIIRGYTAYDATIRLVGQRSPSPEAVAASTSTDDGDEDATTPPPRLPQRIDASAWKSAVGLTGTSSGDAVGFEIDSVTPGGVAAGAGLRAGDRIVSVDGMAWRDQAVAATLASADRSNPVVVQVIRDNRLIERRLAAPGNADGNGNSGGSDVKDKVAAAQRVESDAAEASDSASTMISGLGSVLGGMFGGSSQSSESKPTPEPQPSASTESPEPVAGDAVEELPAPAGQSDTMDFGDDEPIDSDTFDFPPEREL